MKIKRMKMICLFAVDIIMVLSMLLSLSTVAAAATTSPFIGRWYAVDVDGSDLRLAVGALPDGTFQITWTENYISFCDGGAGIVRGIGWLNSEDSNLLDADLHLTCFTSGSTLDFSWTWRYHANTGYLSSSSNGFMILWRRPNRRYLPPPSLYLRVNYGDNWVESFYEGGHTAWVTVTDGLKNVKATAEMVTEPKGYWNGETGFQTLDTVWYDALGNPMEQPPDILPGDWVYGWADNGAESKVQIGEISAVVNITTDSISGTVAAPWFTSNLDIECFAWGAPNPFPDGKDSTAAPDESVPFSCSWAGEWDVRPYQVVGAAYVGSDGHWVANTFFYESPYIQVLPEWEYIMAFDWPDGAILTLTIDDPGTPEEVDFTTTSTSEPTPWSPWMTWAQFNFVNDYDVKPGDVVNVTDGETAQTYTVKYLTLTAADSTEDIIAGTADQGEVVFASTHGEWFELRATTDEFGNWLVDFTEFFDIPAGMDGQAEIRDAYGNATLVDWHTMNPRITVFPKSEYIEAMDWAWGSTVTVALNGSDTCVAAAEVPAKGGAWWQSFVSMNFPEGCDVVAGDVLTVSDGFTTFGYTVQNLAITNFDKDSDTVEGTANSGAEVHAWVHGYGETEMVITAAEGAWLADFASIGFDLQEGMSGRAEIRDGLGNATAEDWYIPHPHFTVFPTGKWFDGLEWPDGADVAITIDGKPECSTAVTSWGGFFNGPFPEDCEIAAGNLVTFTDGVTIRTHTVKDLSITGVDKYENTVSGMAEIGSLVYTWVHGYPNTEFQLPIEDGTWGVDYDSISFDLVENMCGRAEIRNEVGNATAEDWCIPNPVFTAFPETDSIEGWHFDDGVNVHLTVDDPATPESPDIVQDMIAVRPPWDSSTTLVTFNLSEVYDLKPGDLVTLDNGLITRTHSVRTIGIYSVDKDADTVSGTADIGAEVHAWVHGFGETELIMPAADGYWMANFASIGFDLQEGMAGRAEIRDEQGNATAVDWYIPKPHFTVFPEGEWFDGMEWPDGATVNITVDGKTECTTQVTDISGGFFNGGFPEGCNVVAGDVVTFAAGDIIRTHTVENLAITEVNKTADTVTGTADSGKKVHAFVHEHGETDLQIPVIDGVWTADFTSIPFDLTELMGGRVEITDEFGNATAVDWWIPNPTFVIFPEWNWYDGFDWPDGATVDITVAGKAECTTQKTGISGGFFNGGFPETCDIVVGDELTFTDGETTRVHTVDDLQVTDVNPTADTVSGTTAAGTHLVIWTYEEGGPVIETDADEFGNWTADFTGMLDLLEGMQGRVYQYDAQGNATALEWAVPVTLVVTSTTDVLADDGFCTLREAVIVANTNTRSGDLPGECPAGTDAATDTIILTAGETYSLTTDSSFEDGAFDGDLDIWNNTAALDLVIKVEGGLATISQDATVDDRVINNHGATTSLEHLTLLGGNIAGDGGGIAIWSGTVTMMNSVISGNMADWGGGISVIGSALILDNSIVTGSVSTNDGGGIFMRYSDAVGMIPPIPSVVTITNGSQIVNNSAAWGGGISSWSSSLTIDASSIENNTAANSGGGILVHEGGTVSIQDGTTISWNIAQWGGGISNWDANVTIDGSILANNTADGVGGGLENGGVLAVTNSAFLNNTAVFAGGAVWNFAGVENASAVTNSCIVGNSSTAVATGSEAVQNFTLNWWGDPSGPGGIGGGSGDTIGELIDFMPFLTTPPSICAVP